VWLETLVAFIGKSNGNKVFNYFHHKEEITPNDEGEHQEIPTDKLEEDQGSSIIE